MSMQAHDSERAPSFQNVKKWHVRRTDDRTEPGTQVPYVCAHHSSRSLLVESHCRMHMLTVKSHLLPMSMMVMLGLACCLASSSQLARWLKVSLLCIPSN